MKNTDILCVSIYKNVTKDKIIEKFIRVFMSIEKEEKLNLYSEFFYELCNSEFKGNLTKYIFDKVLYSENIFTLECARDKFDDIPEFILKAVKFDLDILFKLATIDFKEFKKHTGLEGENIAEFYVDNHEKEENWCEKIQFFKEYSKQNGYGNYSRNRFFYFEDGNIKPVKNYDKIDFSNLKGYEVQRERIIANTKGLISGVKSNNVLLYGQRGTGKSSTIKAIVNEYASQGLRLVEVSKENLKYLGKIIDELSQIPMKFIVFVDDLTFSTDDDNYTALKAILEGSSNKLSDNMVLYATTNRRHLMAESFSARQGDDVHLKDTLDETSSLSDRFGILITFSFPSPAEYIEIVKKIAQDNDIKIDEKLIAGATAWSARKTSCSPRTATQYIDFVIGQKNQ